MLCVRIIIQKTGAHQVYQSLSQHEQEKVIPFSEHTLSLFTFKYFVRTRISYNKHVLNGRRAAKRNRT